MCCGGSGKPNREGRLISSPIKHFGGHKVLIEVRSANAVTAKPRCLIREGIFRVRSLADRWGQIDDLSCQEILIARIPFWCHSNSLRA
jgi:hypothetical protein